MGQSNELENPELILEKLKGITLNEVGNSNTLSTSFNIINLILNDYKYFTNIITSQPPVPLKRLNSSIMQKKTFIELSKNDIEKKNNQYDKQTITEISHLIERIKKWIKMVKPVSKKNKKKKRASIGQIGESFQQINCDLKPTRVSSQIFIERVKKLSAPIIEPIELPDEELENCSSFKEIRTTKSKKIILSNYTDKKIEMGINEFFETQNSKFIKRLIKGPPDCFRWAAWCIVNFLPNNRNLETYQKFLYKELETENKNRIIRDIQRTFNFGKIDKKKLRKKETSLYNVLKAFWNIDKEVGYCQGMNLIAGFMLIISDFNERDTFYLLLSYFSQTFKPKKKYEYNFRGLFSEEFPLLYHFNFIFDKLLHHYIPNLKKHMDEIGITYDLWVGQWLQTAFTIILPIKWCKRVWDNIFATNIYFLVKFALAFCEIIKDDLLNKDDQELIVYFKDLKNNSLSEDSEFLDLKADVNTVIIRANKIKLQIDDYIKMYKKTEEGFAFVEQMENLQDACFDYNAVENTRLSFGEEIKRKRTKLFDELKINEEGEEEDKVGCLSDDNESNLNIDYIKNNLIEKNEKSEVDSRKKSKYKKRRRTRYTVTKGLLNKHKMLLENEDENSDKEKNNIKLRNIDNNDEKAFIKEKIAKSEADGKILRYSIASSNSNMEKEMIKNLGGKMESGGKNMPDKILVSVLKGKNNNSENNNNSNKQEKKLDVKFNITKNNEGKE